jgi:hypothetical protein
MIPAERKSELLLREDRPKVIIYEFFNTIRRFQPLARSRSSGWVAPFSAVQIDFEGRGELAITRCRFVTPIDPQGSY